MHKLQLWQLILAGMILGALTGIILSPHSFGIIPTMEDALVISEWFALPGKIFLGVIMMVMMPLVFSAIVTGISSSGDVGFVKKIGGYIVPYFFITSILAVGIGVVLTVLIRPGDFVDGQALLASSKAPEFVTGVIKDLTTPQRIMNLVPTNFFKSGYNLDLMQIVVGSIFTGLVTLSLPRETTKIFIDLCDCMLAMSLKVISWAMVFAPIAVFGMLADVFIRVGIDIFAGLGAYMFTVLLGLFCIYIMYGLIILLLARRSPIWFFKNIKEVIIFGFSTSSSSATMPVTMRVAKDNLKIDDDVTQFVIPLGTTINLDGTGMYQAVAAIFLCQLVGIDLSIMDMILLTLTMVGASIGTPSTPGVGIVILATIVTGMGVPAAGIGLIMGVDRILDMARTTVNVTGDLTAAVVMERWLGKAKPDVTRDSPQVT
jgi:proton glutamate symport protein